MTAPAKLTVKIPNSKCSEVAPSSHENKTIKSEPLLAGKIAPSTLNTFPKITTVTTDT